MTGGYSRIDFEVHVGKKLFGALAHLRAINDVRPIEGLSVHEQVLCHAHQIKEAALLIDDRDAELLGMMLIANVNCTSARERYLSRIRLIDARQNVHQSALAGAVLAGESVYLRGFHFEIYIRERANTRKGLCD